MILLNKGGYLYVRFIVKPMTDIFQSLHRFIEQMGVTGGLSYVLAIFIFTVVIRLLILPLTIKGSKLMQECKKFNQN